MNILKYKSFDGSAEVDMDRKECHGKVLYIDDVVTYRAKDPSALEVEFKLAVDDYIETCSEIGKEPQKPCRGLFNVRVSPELHRAAIERAVRDGVTLNTVVGRALDSYLDSSTVANSKVGDSTSNTIAQGTLSGLTYQLVPASGQVTQLVSQVSVIQKGAAFVSTLASTNSWSDFEMGQTNRADKPGAEHVH